MSKGEIIEHVGEGLYRVRQKLAVDRIQQELERVNARLAELAVELPTKKLELMQAEDAVADKARDIDLKIADLQEGVDGARQEISRLHVDLVRLQSAAAQLRVAVNGLIAEDLSNRKRQNQLQQVPDGRELNAWCADYSLELSGEVGLVDINDEGGQGVLIKPGFDDSAVYAPGSDGALFPNLAQSGIQIYFNSAILPGVQKWLPRYRIGTITKINLDACNLDLDPATSSAQGLNINKSDTLEQVPIQYMDCNGEAFEEGDRVLVRFTRNGPLVVGFEKEPTECSAGGIVFWPTQYYLDTGQVSKRILYGPPYEGSVIGEENNLEGVWKLSKRAADYSVKKGERQNFGYQNWHGPGNYILSWDGIPSRFYDVYGIGEPDTKDFPTQPGGFVGWRNDWFPAKAVYYRNKILHEFDNSVYGAAVTQIGDQRYLLAVTGSGDYFSSWYQLERIKMSGKAFIDSSAVAEVVHEFELPPGVVTMSGWYFSEDGKKAVCTGRNDQPVNQSYLLFPQEVYRLDLDIETGFSSELVFSSDQQVGITSSQRTVTERTYQFENNLPTDYVGVIDYQSQRSASQFDFPLYFDFVADELVTTYYRVPAYSGSERDNWDRLINSVTLDERRLRNIDVDYTAPAPEQILTSQGKVLATAPFTRKEAVDIDRHSSNGATEFTDQALPLLTRAMEPVVIDARFDLAIVSLEYFIEQSTLTASNVRYAPGTFDEIADYSYTGTSESRVELRVFFGSDDPEVLEIYSDYFSGTNNYTRSYIIGQPAVSPQGSFSAALNAETLVNYGSRGMMWGSGFRTEQGAGYSVVYSAPASDGSRQPVWASYLEGYGDAVAELLNQSAEDGYVLNRLTVI